MERVRILVVGDCGSGKSRFIATLAGGAGVNLNSSGLAGLSTDHAEFCDEHAGGACAADGGSPMRGGGAARRRRRAGGRAAPGDNSSTVGCALSCFIVERHSAADNSSRPKPMIVELLEVGAHERFMKLRRLFYRDVDGVIIVYDLSSRRTARSVAAWVDEIRENASFSGGEYGGFDGSGGGEYGGNNSSMGITGKVDGVLPVPLLVVGNKDDLSDAQLQRKARDNSGEKIGGGWFCGAWNRLYTFMLKVTAPAWLMRLLFFRFGRKAQRGDTSILGSKMETHQYRGPMTRACSTMGRVDRLEIDSFFEKCIASKTSANTTFPTMY